MLDAEYTAGHQAEIDQAVQDVESAILGLVEVDSSREPAETPTEDASHDSSATASAESGAASADDGGSESGFPWIIVGAVAAIAMGAVAVILARKKK